jgi:branched-chain amino acid transport system substrate-binding protein
MRVEGARRGAARRVKGVACGALAVVVLAAGVAAAACGSAAPASQQSPSSRTVTIAVQEPRTGELAGLRRALGDGVTLAVEQLAGPLRAKGLDVTVALYDTGGVPATGAANAAEIVADPHVLGVVGHASSGVNVAASEVYHEAGLVCVSPSDTSPEVTARAYPEVDRVIGRDDVQGAVGARFAVAEGARTAAVVFSDDVYGRGLGAAFRAAAADEGLEVRSATAAAPDAKPAALAGAALAGAPDVLYYAGLYGQGARLFKAARKAGFRGLCLSGDGFDWSEAAAIGGAALLQGEGTCFTTLAGQAGAYPGAARFVADYRAEFGQAPAQFAAQAYDAAAILLDAILRARDDAAGLPTRAAVAAAVRTGGPYEGITGTYAFDEVGDLTEAQYFVVQVGSADPAAWGGNPIVKSLSVSPSQP